MANINIENIKNRIDSGVNTVKDACEAAKDITIHPKLSASFTVKNESANEKHFDKGVNFDKKLTLWNVICFVLAVIAAFVAASIIVNSLFSLFSGDKKNKRSKISKDIKTDELKEADID